MAGPINGIGVPQVPAANTFQPGQNTQVQEDRPAQDSTAQPQSNAAAETQDTANNTQDVLATQQEAAARPEQSDPDQQQETPRRGSTVDVLV